jgi:hypothetical protein
MDVEVAVGGCRGGGGGEAGAAVAVDVSVETALEEEEDACFNAEPNCELKGLGAAAVEAEAVEGVIIEGAREAPVLGQTAAGAVFGTRPLLLPLPPLLLLLRAGALSSSSVATLLLEFIVIYIYTSKYYSLFRRYNFMDIISLVARQKNTPIKTNKIYFLS